MQEKPQVTPLEARAFSAARRALQSGRLRDAALAYEVAARERERAQGDAFGHRLQAAELWTAAGDPRRALLACRRARARQAGSTVARRGAWHLARGAALGALGRHREAARDFAAARKLLARDPASARKATLQLAESLLALGRVTRARALLGRQLALALRSGDPRSQAEALHGLGRAFLQEEDPFEAIGHLAEAEGLARGVGVAALAAACAVGLAQAHLRLERFADARAHAERAGATFRAIRDGERAAGAALLEAEALGALADRLEERQGKGAGAGLRDRAAKLARRDSYRGAPRHALPGRAPAPPPAQIEFPPEAEPRLGALGRVLAARSLAHRREAEPFRTASTPRRVAPSPRSTSRPSPPRPVSLPRLAPGEALIAFAERLDEVHAWVVTSRPRRVSHFRMGSAERWRAAARLLQQQARDAAGWPDAVVPESLVRSGRRALDSLAAQAWTPLWPALAGVAGIFVLPDPGLPELPWAALALSAPPRAWPRPRSVSLLPSTTPARPPGWRLPTRRLLALAERTAELPLAEREARGVARIVGGEWLAIPALATADEDPRAALLSRLRRARLWHLAARVTVDPEVPALSHIDLGGLDLPLWRIGRAGVAPRLAVLPWCLAEPRPAPLVGRVVGRVGPEGARRLATPVEPRSAPWSTGGGGAARALLAAGAARAVVSTWPLEAGATVGVIGSFYAGLARGDAPAAALFAAQRRAADEGLHPAEWAGFEIWGWG